MRCVFFKHLGHKLIKVAFVPKMFKKCASGLTCMFVSLNELLEGDPAILVDQSLLCQPGCVRGLVIGRQDEDLVLDKVSNPGRLLDLLELESRFVVTDKDVGFGLLDPTRDVGGGEEGCACVCVEGF